MNNIISTAVFALFVRRTPALLMLLLGMTFSWHVNANEPTDSAQAGEVALSVEALKKKVIRLNRDLFILEEDLLFPANTQFNVFLSLDTGKFFKPDSVVLKLNDEVVGSHLYTERQQLALSKGGMQRLYVGNLKSGEHTLTAVAVGAGTDGREIKKAATLKFEKGTDITSLEVRINDRSENYQASIDIIQWDN